LTCQSQMILILCWNSAEYSEQSIRRKKEEACHGGRSFLNGPFLNRLLWRSNHEQAELHRCTAEFSFMRLSLPMTSRTLVGSSIFGERSSPHLLYLKSRGAHLAERRPYGLW
jgi:hypothetical protein